MWLRNLWRILKRVDTQDSRRESLIDTMSRVRYLVLLWSTTLVVVFDTSLRKESRVVPFANRHCVLCQYGRAADYAEQPPEPHWQLAYERTHRRCQGPG